MSRLRILAISLVVVASACGGHVPPPQRRVIEANVDDWSFRRYQHVVDVEVYIDGNSADAHTASYARIEAVKAGRLTDADVVSAFVTEYARPDGVAPALVKFARRLAQEQGYAVDEEKLGGQRVFLVKGHDEAWAFWSSGHYVVKVGGRGRKSIPAALVKAYGKRYPSKVVEDALNRPLQDVELQPTGRSPARKKK